MIPLLLALACQGVGLRGDAARYHHALVEADSYAASARACQGIERSSTRNDCLLAVLERWDRLEDAYCEPIEDARLADECRFQLAERRFVAGDLPGAIATCESSRFHRPCSWHLVRDVAEATWEQPMQQAQDHVDAFARARSIPDAGKHFWLVRFREEVGHGGVLDERRCHALRDPVACHEAMYAYVQDLLTETARTDLERLCAAEPGRRVLLRGRPTWEPGPITTASEAAWVAHRCGPPAPPGPPRGPAPGRARGPAPGQAR